VVAMVVPLRLTTYLEMPEPESVDAVQESATQVP
jgi:hypothetical protein